MKTLQIKALSVFCGFLGVYCRFLFFVGLDRDQVEAKLRRVSGPVAFLAGRITRGRP